MDIFEMKDEPGHDGFVTEYGVMDLERHFISAPRSVDILKGFVAGWIAALVLAIIFDLLQMQDYAGAAVLYVALVVMSIAAVFCFKSGKRDRRSAQNARLGLHA